MQRHLLNNGRHPILWMYWVGEFWLSTTWYSLLLTRLWVETTRLEIVLLPFPQLGCKTGCELVLCLFLLVLGRFWMLAPLQGAVSCDSSVSKIGSSMCSVDRWPVTSDLLQQRVCVPEAESPLQQGAVFPNPGLIHVLSTIFLFHLWTQWFIRYTLTSE